MPIDQEFDFEAFDKQWEAEQAETELLDVEDNGAELMNDVDESDNFEDSGVVGDGNEETEELEEDQQQESPPEVIVNDPDVEKRNAAFAQLRRERDEAQKQAAFIQKLAEENGMTVEELQQRYEDSRLQEEAESQNVPVEVLQRLKSLEQENEAIKNQSFSARFNAEVEATIEKYKPTEQELEATFAYAQQQGLTEALKSGSMNFETVHRMAHMDALIERQVQNAIQDSLSKKKKRQQEATVSHSSGASAVEPTLEDRAIADAKALLESGNF